MKIKRGTKQNINIYNIKYINIVNIIFLIICHICQNHVIYFEEQRELR